MSHDETALDDILRRRDGAARRWARDPQHVCLIAVSKTFDAAAIEPVLQAGQRHFGENRVQEAQEKWPPLKARYEAVQLHLLGPLQTNKAKEAVALFDVIHSLDRLKLAEKLAALRDEMGPNPGRDQSTTQGVGGSFPDLFIQINTGEEPQKAGITPQDAPAFIDDCRDRLGLPIIGLMCIPPVDDVPAPHFALLAKLAKQAGLPGLSMGMSDDFEVAIAQGATHIRVGRALFGGRPAN